MKVILYTGYRHENYSLHLLQTWKLFFTLVADMKIILYTGYRHENYSLHWLQTWKLFFTLVTDMKIILYTVYRYENYSLHWLQRWKLFFTECGLFLDFTKNEILKKYKFLCKWNVLI